jgi:hypothetical protein
MEFSSFFHFAHISSCTSPSIHSKNTQFINEKKKTMTSLVASWVCQNMRPMSIIEDEGFINIIQKCLTWNNGKEYLIN